MSMSDTTRTTHGHVRSSSQVGATRGILVSVGVWLVIGVYALAGNTFQLAGSQAAFVYLISGLLFTPTLLSWAELMGWVRGVGGIFRLVRAAQRPGLSFVVGMAYLLGWVALSALVAQSFAAYTAGLLSYLMRSLPDQRLLVLPLVMLFAIANLTGYHSRRKTQIVFLSMTILTLLALVGAATLQAIAAGQMQLDAVPSMPGGNVFGGAVLLVAAMWASNIAFEMQGESSKSTRILLVGALSGPVIGFLLAFVAMRAVAPDILQSGELLLVAIANKSIGPAAVPVMFGLGIVLTAATWQIITLASLRQMSSMAQRGWLPGWMHRTHPRFGTPHRLILVNTLVVLVFVVTGAGFWLGRVSAMAMLLTGIGVNVTAFLLSDDPRGQHRNLRLPFGRLVPSVGIATNVLLLSSLGLPVLLFGALWIGLGFAIFWRYSQEQEHESKRGVTVFHEDHAEKERAPFTVLVPIGDTQRDTNLIAFAETIARHRGGQVMALHVVEVPDTLRLDSGRREARKRLEEVERFTDNMEQHGVSIRATTRLSRRIARGIMDTIGEEDPDLVVMGWHARSQAGGDTNLGHILDEVVSNATSDVAVLRGDWPYQPARILVPTSGGPNAPLALELGQSLTSYSGGMVTLLNVLRHPASQQEIVEAKELLLAQIETLHSPEGTETKVIVSEGAVDGILSEAEQYDVVMLGASEENLLDQAIFGKVPEMLALKTESPVAMVRRRRGLPSFWLRKAWDSLSEALPTLEREEQLAVYQRLRRAARPNINYFVLITLSALIATLGLLLDSPAVIIGAMLVAPLMTPIVSTAIGISFGDVRTLRISIESTLQGVLVAIFVAIVVARISPLQEMTSEILARTRPGLLDLFVALASGLAGAYAIARKEVSDALPGVAVAAALMPPVCTIGIGLATGNLTVAGGAALLFSTNLIAITLAGTIVFLLLGIRPPEERERHLTLRRYLATTAISLMVVSLPLAYILFQTTGIDRLNLQVAQTLEVELADWESTGIESITVDSFRDKVNVTATLRTSQAVSQADVDALGAVLEQELNRPVQLHLQLVPISELKSNPASP